MMSYEDIIDSLTAIKKLEKIGFITNNSDVMFKVGESWINFPSGGDALQTKKIASDLDEAVKKVALNYISNLKKQIINELSQKSEIDKLKTKK